MKTTQDLHGLTLAELPHVYQKTQFAGSTLTRTFKGLENDILAKETEMLNLGYVTKHTQGPLWTLECVISNVDQDGNPDTGEDGTEGYVQDDGLSIAWEIQPQISSKDLMETNLVYFMRDLGTDYKKYLKDSFNDPDNVDKSFIPFTSTPPKTAAQHTAAEKGWKLMLNGATSVDINFPLVRRTITPNRNYSLLGFDSNTNRIFSWASFVSIEGVPNNFAQVLPNYYYPDVSNIVTIDGLYYSYGYKKNPLMVGQVSTTKNQVTQEWSFGLWSNDIYGPMI